MTAKAALISIDYDQGITYHQIFREDWGHSDPVRSAEQFRASVGDDFPSFDHYIVANKEAWEITGERRMKEWFGIDE